MALAPGTRLGAYEIVGLVGAGGMGEVYRATDTNLKRQVAIKVLPEELAADPERLARFQREAEALAALNHPHIAQIHGLERSHAMTALVMELVEGPTLADRIEHGAIPVEEALPIARQMTEALESAHEHGIIHRDLKPANIKVRPDGTVKILDFGLAKAFTADRAGPSTSMLANSPTITSPVAMTGVGIILGTAAYMAPEQAKGRVVDKRVDIWSFGCVLFEMLAGTRAFQGDEVTDTLAAVLRSDPPWSGLPQDVPSRVRQVIRLCLQKDPKQRIQAFGDIRLVLDDALGESDGPPAAQDRGWRKWTVLTIAAGVLVFMGWFVGGRVPRGGSAPPARTLRLSVDLPSTEQLANLNEFGELAPVSLSPDGQTIVYAALRGGVRQLFRRRFDQGVATPIPGTEGARVSFFSPDGSTIGFSTDSDLKKVSLAGGEPVLVRQLWQSGVLRAASWGDDGTIVVGFQNFENPLWSLPASSGEPRRFTSLTERGENVHHDPAHLPGDRGLLYSANGKTIILRSRDGKESVLTEGRSPRFVASGHIVFLRNQSLWAMAFDPNSAAAGSPVKIADGVAGSIAVSADGTLVYVGGRPGAAQLVWVDANGHEQVVAGGPTGAYQDVVLSPDGGRIALTVRTPDYGTDVFVYHVGRQRLTQITAEGGLTSAPLWTPDGKQLVFSSSRDKALRNLFRRAADGTGDIERLTTSPYQQSAWSWSADGQTLVMNQLNSDTSYDILGASVGALDKPLALVQTKETDLHPAVSPNGHLIAYSSGGQIWVSPFPNVSESHLQVSTAGGGQSRWSSDSRTLFYRSASAIMAATVVTSPALDVSVPRLVLKGEYMAPGGTKSWDVAPDGRFLLMKPVPAEPSIQVVLNWTEELKRLVPPK